MRIKKFCQSNCTGSGGVIVTALCCLGFPVFIGILSAIGLGFLINDYVLFPLLALFLGIKIYSSYINKKRHKNKYPFIISIIGAILMFPALFISIILGYIVVGIIFLSAIWDMVLLRKLKNGKNN